jgi:hypothetical protein
MTMVSVETVQEPFVMAQRSVTEVPAVNPEMVVTGSFGESIVAVPGAETKDQVPVPTAGVLAAMVAVARLHKAMSGPAEAVVGSWSTCILTVSVEAVQVPLLMVHTSEEEAPAVKEVTAEVLEAAVETSADPEGTVHKPVPMAGLFAASVVEVTLQSTESAPAFAVVGTASIRITMSSEEAGHAPLAMVQRITEEAPTESAVIPEVLEAGVVMLAVPETRVHVPVPVTGTLPARVVVVILQKAWSAPASAVVGVAETLISMVSLEAGQLALLIVHTSAEVPPMVKLETAEVLEAGVVTEAVPGATTDHTPVPTAGAFAERVVTVVLHRFLSVPAAAVVGFLSTVMSTVSVEDTQVPLDTVHFKVAVLPGTSAVMAEVAEFCAAMVAVPEITDQVPVPVTTGVAVIAVLVTLHNILSVPALAVSGRLNTVITTVSSVGAHPPSLMVHFKVAEAPGVSPVMVVTGSLLLAKVTTVPEILVQVPVPEGGVFPASVAVVTLHKFWSLPARAVAEGAPTWMITSLTEAGQTPFEMVHLKVSVVGADNKVTPESGLLSSVMSPLLRTTDQTPVPTAGVFAARVVEVTLQRFCAGPAAATVGEASVLTVTLSDDAVHAPLVMVHLRTEESPIVKLARVVSGLFGKSMVAVPEMRVQVPVPTVAVFPASVAVVTLHKAMSAPALAVVGSWSTWMLMVSVAAVQVPLLTVHIITEAAPAVSPVTAEAAAAGVEATAEPDKVVHAPVPAAGAVAASVVVVTLHSGWSAPAAAVGTASMRMIMSSVEGVQAPLAMVHRSVAEVPTGTPVTPEVAKEGVVIKAVPETSVHAPVPTAAGVAAKVVVVTLQNAWSAPAAAVEGVAATLMAMVSLEAGQLPLEMVQTKAEAPPMVKLETAEEGEEAVVTEAVPGAITDQLPAPTTGVFAARVVTVVLHKFLSVPAAAVVGALSTEMVMSSEEDVQVPLVTVQRRVTALPKASPVTAEVAEFIEVTEAAPEITDQVPVPETTGVAASVVEVTLQSTWSVPALAVSGRAATVTVRESAVGAHPPSLMVQISP